MTETDCSYIHDAAERLAADLRAAGHAVEHVSRSINREGGCSAYVSVAGWPRLRISDHSTATMLNTIDCSPNASVQDVEAMWRWVSERRAAGVAAAQAERLIRDEREAPYRARYIAETLEENRLAIMLEIHPGLATDKAARKEVRRRWLAP